ncbi:MAG: hypothetical protein GF375_01030 [Candidatus Omnitrophica bacterium]|nr:hypothetical protein [Candidatus Omnitrophota bacterium]MBD3268721.1 hypothetical protein [Candidatus Omnitrophota bacterium]
MVNFDDFSRLELRTGKIMEVESHPDAEKLFVLKVNIGEKAIQLVAGIKPFYSSQELIGKSIVVLVNLEPKDIRGVRSEGMLLAAQAKDDVSLIVPNKDVPEGTIIR